MRPNRGAHLVFVRSFCYRLQPAIRILKELHPLPVGKLYLARDNDTKVPYYMHVLNRHGDDEPTGGATTVGAANADKLARTPGKQLTEVKELWNEMARLNHPYLMKHVSNGESIDRMWQLYSYPHHASLQYHIAALVKQRQDALALSVLSSPSSALPAPPAMPIMLLPPAIVEHFAVEILLLLDYLHARHIVALNLDLMHLHLTDQGHLALVDFFIAENKEGAVKRRGKKEERYWSQTIPSTQIMQQ
jgi:hypothetical protein